MAEELELEELIAGDEMLTAFKGKITGLGTRRDENVLSFEHISFDRNGCGSDEPRSSVKRRDARLQKPLFTCAGHVLDEPALEAHEFRPFDPKVLGGEAPPAQAVRVIDRFGRADEYFLGIASAQRTGAAKRTGINNGHGPTSPATLVRHRGRSSGSRMH